MKNKFNFKIVGSGPTGLLLSIALSKFDCNIFLTDLLTKDRLIDKDKTYAITHSTRKILSKFRLWEKLEPFLFGFDTLSISDSVTSAITNLSILDLDNDISSAGNIGWVIKHSDLMNIFFQEIEYLKSQNLIKGGSLDNAIVIKDKKPLNKDGLRYDNELMRHKVLDVVGDLYLSGFPIIGTYKGFKTGHFITNNLLKELFKSKENYKIHKIN